MVLHSEARRRRALHVALGAPAPNDLQAAERAVEARPPEVLVVDLELEGWRDVVRGWRQEGLDLPVVGLGPPEEGLAATLPRDAPAEAIRDAAHRLRPPPPNTLQLSVGLVDLLRRRHTPAQGAPVRLSKMECLLLGWLAVRAGRVFSRDTLLRHVWGYRRGVTSRAVDQTVSRLRGKIEADPSAPQHLVTVYAAGYRLDLAPRLAPRGWPMPSGPLRGRADERAEVARLLESGARLVTLLGPGGVGKTRLATEVVRPLGHRAIFCDLSATSTKDDLLHAVAAALETSLPSQSGARHLGAALRRRGRLTILMDNLEGVVESTDVLLDWLELAPDLQILATSRIRLDLCGERCVWLGPLAEPDAIDLYLERAAAVGGEPGEREVVRKLVRGLDHLPLAIELAAGRAHALSARQLLQRLDRRLDLLRRSGGGRQGSMRRVLEDSWSLLDDGARRILGEASVFASPFSLEAAEAVLSLDDGSVAEGLASLVDRSLLQRVDDGRFRMAEGLRTFISEADLDLHGAYARHAAWVLRRGRELFQRVYGPAGLHALEGLAHLRVELLAVARRTREPDRRLEAHCLVAEQLWRVGVIEGVVELLDGVHADADVTLRIRSYHLRARLLDRAGHHQAATEAIEAGLHLSREAARWCQAARLQLLWARLHLQAGRLEDAWTLLQDARPRLHDDPADEGLCLARMATVRREQGRRHEAEALYQEALTRLREGAAQHHEITALIGWATLLQHQGEVPGAQRLLRQALALAEGRGDQASATVCHHNLANLAMRRADLVEAAEGYAAVLEHQRQIGFQRGVCFTLVNLGSLRLRQGQDVEAMLVLAEAQALARQLQLDTNEAVVLSLRAWHAHARGQLQAVEGLLDEAQRKSGAHSRLVAAIELQRRLVQAELGEDPGVDDPLVGGFAHLSCDDTPSARTSLDALRQEVAPAEREMLVQLLARRIAAHTSGRAT